MHRLTLAILLAAGCSSDQKLNEDVGPNGDPGTIGLPGTTSEDPGNGTGDPGNGTGDPGNGTGTDTTTPTDGYGNPVGDDDDSVPTTLPEPGDTGLTDEEICNAAATLAGFLDPYQTPDDGRVLYCHSLHLNDSDISSCLPHLNHSTDTFPTSGCDT